MPKEKAVKKIDIERVRHSLAHLLAAAVLQEFPTAKLGIGPVIESGFYYDFLLPRKPAPDDLKKLEALMRAFIRERLPFRSKKITAAAAKKLFKDQPLKIELISDLIKEKQPITIYETGSAKRSGREAGNYFIDL